MGMLEDRLVMTGPQAVLRSTGASVTDVVARLEADETPARLLEASGLAPADLVAALAYSALGGDESLGPSLVQARPPRAWLARALGEPAWAPVFSSAPHRSRLALAAGLLQIHDFWDASHNAAQEADDQGERGFSAYWHGIAHRREPDDGNAAYWFRRVGKHPTFVPLAREAQPLLDAHGDSQLTARLTGGGGWNPGAMIDLCTQAPAGSARETLARRLQRLEMWLLLEATLASLS